MKKRFLLLKFFVPAVMLAMVSCDKEELPDLTIKEMAFSGLEAVLKEIQVSKINSNGHVYDFSYGSNGKPDKVISFYQSEENEDGISYKLEEEYALVYESDRLKEVNNEYTYTRNLANGTQEREGGTKKVAYLYNENGLVKEVQTTFFYKLPDNSERETTFSHQYEYNKENKVVKITDNSTGQKSSGYYTLEWNGGNLMKQTHFYEQAGEGQRKQSGCGNEFPGRTGFMRTQAAMADETEAVFVFSDYDDKINPMMLFAILHGGSAGMNHSENNAGKIVNYKPDENGNLTESQVTTIDRAYDSKGRPARYKVSLTVYELDATYVSEYTITYRD